MAKAYQAPPGVEIAALKGKKGTGALDLMMPGEGTPWEDRGALGLVKAFFATCMKSITSPAFLLDHIRRPDTTGEASQFAYVCSALWVISIAVHGIVYHVMHPVPADWMIPEGQFYLKYVILGVLAGAAAYGLGVMFASRMYFSLISTELKNKAPRVLLHNMFCYSLGPSLLVLIPVAGPLLAIALIFRAWIVGGTKRLYSSWRGAIVASVLSMLMVLVGAVAVEFVGNIVLNNVLGLGKPDFIIEQEEQQAKLKSKAPGR